VGDVDTEREKRERTKERKVVFKAGCELFAAVYLINTANINAQKYIYWPICSLARNA